MKRLIPILLILLPAGSALQARELVPQEKRFALEAPQSPLHPQPGEPAAELSPASETTGEATPRHSQRQRFLPMKRRMDREIDKIKFAYAGEVALGLTVSYGTLNSDDTDFLLIADNLNLDGSVFTINPSVGYFFRNNQCAGVRFGYSTINGSLDTANINLGESNDINLAFNNIHLMSNALSIGLYYRSYAGLDRKGHFGLFGEFDLSAKSGSSELTYKTADRFKTTRSENLQIALGFNPGLAVYIFPNVCSTISFGLGGIEYTKIKQKDEAGNVVGERTASKMRFRLNLLNIRVGMTVHLWNKKANKA